MLSYSGCFVRYKYFLAQGTNPIEDFANNGLEKCARGGDCPVGVLKMQEKQCLRSVELAGCC